MIKTVFKPEQSLLKVNIRNELGREAENEEKCWRLQTNWMVHINHIQPQSNLQCYLHEQILPPLTGGKKEREREWWKGGQQPCLSTPSSFPLCLIPFNESIGQRSSLEVEKCGHIGKVLF